MIGRLSSILKFSQAVYAVGLLCKYSELEINKIQWLPRSNVYILFIEYLC